MDSDFAHFFFKMGRKMKIRSEIEPLLKKLWGHIILEATLAYPLEAASYHASIKNTKSRNLGLRCGHQEWPTQGGNFFTKMSDIIFWCQLKTRETVVYNSMQFLGHFKQVFHMFYQYRYWGKMQLRMNVYKQIYQFGSLFSLHFDKKKLVKGHSL